MFRVRVKPLVGACARAPRLRFSKHHGSIHHARSGLFVVSRLARRKHLHLTGAVLALYFVACKPTLSSVPPEAPASGIFLQFNEELRRYQLTSTPLGAAHLNTSQVYVDLFNQFDQAIIDTSNPKYVGRFSGFTVNKKKRDVITMHPNSRMTFPDFTPKPGSVLYASFGIRDEAWDRGTDGVAFKIWVVEDGHEPVLLLRKFLGPGRGPSHREWQDTFIPLDEYDGRRIAIRLQTTAGPAQHKKADWAVWSGLKVFIHHK